MKLPAVIASVALAGLAFAPATTADSSCQPPAGPSGDNGGCVQFSPGNQERGSAWVTSGSAGGSIDFSAYCPEPSPPPNDGNFWGITVGLTDQNGHHMGDDYFAGPDYEGATYTDSYPFIATIPDGESTDTWTWAVTLECDGMTTTIGSGSFTLCRGATKASQAGKDFIKMNENRGVCKKQGGVKVCGQPCLNTYDDGSAKPCGRNGKGNCTIGWGHKVHNGPCECTDPAATCTNDDEDDFYKGIDEREADRLFDDDVSAKEAIFNKLPSLPLNQCQFDALTDFFFNEGRGPLYANGTRGAPSKIVKALRSGDYDAIPGDILQYDKKNPALHQRREADASMFGGACDGC